MIINYLGKKDEDCEELQRSLMTLNDCGTIFFSQKYKRIDIHRIKQP